ncbi:MAG: LamG-like jellyroll fold domain-containing protein [Verrucomicrobiales bacterium]
MKSLTKSLILALSLVAPVPLQADLVAHWTLEEGAGTVAADSTANNRTGTLTAGATWTSDNLPAVPSGSSAALDLDGLTGQVDIVGYQGVTGTQDRSVTAWVRTRQTTPVQNKGIVSWGQNVGTNKWTFRIQNSNGTAGAIRIEVNGGYFVGNTVVTDGEWHHVAVTWANDGTPDVEDARLYVDGVLDAEFGSLTVPPSASLSQVIDTTATADVRIGNNFQTNHNWDGWIDDVRIYDEEIDAATIAALASGTAIITSFDSDAEIVASGAAVELSWVTDPTNDSLVIDNGVGDVLGTEMTTVNPTADTTYKLTGTRGGTTNEREVTVLVEKAPLINSFRALGPTSIFPGGTVDLVWDVFGEASLDLNGTDVSAQAETTVAPAVTTTYTLSAINQWGTTTAEVLVTVLPGGEPDLRWTAEGLPDGNLAAWTPSLNATINNGLVFNNNTGGSVVSGASNFSGITQWVSNPGFNFFANPNDSWQDGLGGPATMANVSWELVFRPGDFTGTHTLFNTGGNGDGTAFVLTGSVVDFRFQDANADAQRLIVAADLATIGTAEDFYHLIGLADVETAATGTGTLYVNGELAAGPTTSTGTINDWDGGDLAELGKGGNIPGGNPFAFDAFSGDIAIFSYFGGRLLSEETIMERYTALAGNPSAFEITTIIYNEAEQRIEITFNSRPNGRYAIDGGTDLSTLLEIDDSITSQGTETTVFVGGLDLPDPALPRQFYQIREVN